jgi:hypothetical protein
MANEDIDKAKLRLDEERLELEKARLELEKSYSKRYITPLISILGAIVAGLFALAQVWVASIQKAKEIEAAQIQKEREIEIAALERERRWKLDMADFVFRNREAIFSDDKDADQQRIIKVIAVTFPTDISAILFENLKATVPHQQIPLDDGQRLVEVIQVSKGQGQVDERLWDKSWECALNFESGGRGTLRFDKATTDFFVAQWSLEMDTPFQRRIFRSTDSRDAFWFPQRQQITFYLVKEGQHVKTILNMSTRTNSKDQTLSVSGLYSRH